MGAIRTICSAFLLFFAISAGTIDEAQASRPTTHFMPTGFFSYEAPSHSAGIVMFHPSQTIILIEARIDGWARIYTRAGDAWVNLHHNRFNLDRRFGLHYYKGQEGYSETIAPRTVDILQAYEDWLKISTAFGPRWVNLNFEPCPGPLYELMRGYGNNFAMLYMDLASGFTFMHNPDRVFNAASVNKIQHALYMYVLAERGEIDLQRVHTLRPGDRRSGTGRIQHRAYGDTFTSRYLLGQSIRSSDNTAFQMLVRQYGQAGYLDFVREIGANEEFVRNVIHSRISVRDAAVWGVEIYNYLMSGGTYSQMFRNDLMNTNMQIISSAYPLANKYGWFLGYFHDFAIVFADSPYLLVILSDTPNPSWEAFRVISSRVQAFHRTYFGR